jgi:hypothetical protein
VVISAADEASFVDPFGVVLGRLIFIMLCSANRTCTKGRIKTVAARQGGLEAFDNDDFCCSKGQGGVIDDAFMGVVFG